MTLNTADFTSSSPMSLVIAHLYTPSYVLSTFFNSRVPFFSTVYCGSDSSENSGLWPINYNKESKFWLKNRKIFFQYFTNDYKYFVGVCASRANGTDSFENIKFKKQTVK